MPTRTESQTWTGLLLGILAGPILFTTCTAIINLPGGRVEVNGRALIFDGDTLTLTVPFAGVASVDDATPDTTDPIDAPAP